MTTQGSQEDQPCLFMDDEDRLDYLETVPADGREALADLFIILRRGMTKEGCGPQVVQAELDRFIELLFRDSEAYRLTLQLYVGRYEIIGGKEAADILREVVAEKLSLDEDRQESLEEGDREEQGEA